MAEKKKSLGEFLKDLRLANKLTLRDVEKKKQISNAYLSQLENEQIKQPSPNILYKLSELYNYPYDALLKRAGYIVPKKQQSTRATSEAFAVFSSVKDLTEEEAETLVEYLNWIRSRRPKGANDTR